MSLVFQETVCSSKHFGTGFEGSDKVDYEREADHVVEFVWSRNWEFEEVRLDNIRSQSIKIDRGGLYPRMLFVLRAVDCANVQHSDLEKQTS